MSIRSLRQTMLACAGVAVLVMFPTVGQAQAAVPLVTARLEVRAGAADGPGSMGAITGLAVGERGTMYVLDALAPAVHAFDAQGRHLRSFGRRGGGPGEFATPHRIGFRGDSLWVVDTGHQRTTFFDARGGVLRTATLPVRARPSDPAVTAHAWLADGSVLVIPPGPRETRAVTRIPLIRADRSGTVIDTVDWLSLRNRALVFPVGAGSMTTQQPWSDAPLTATATNGTGIVTVRRQMTGSRPTFTVTRYRASGAHVYTRTFQAAPVPFPREWADQWAESLARGIVRQSGGQAETVAAAIRRGLYIPRYLPPVNDAVAGQDGTVWLRRESRPGARDVLWQLLDENGRLVLQTRLADGFRGLDGDRSHLWGTMEDEHGVPRVVRYSIGRR